MDQSDQNAIHRNALELTPREVVGLMLTGAAAHGVTADMDGAHLHATLQAAIDETVAAAETAVFAHGRAN